METEGLYPPIRSQITASLMTRMSDDKDAIIMQAIRDTGADIAIADAEEIHRRGRFELYPDKTEIFYWDGEPLIQFGPMIFDYDGARMMASQPYRMIAERGKKWKSGKR